MTTYLLHGGMLAIKSASNDAYFKRIAAAVPNGGTVLIVLFAADESRWPQLIDTMKGYIESVAGGKNIAFTQATKANFINELKTADAVLIRGGETNRLLATLQEYPDLRQALDGKLVAGSSAGAYAFGTYNYSRSAHTLREGLGFVPSRVLCHYESSDPKESNGPEALSIMESDHQELPLIVLRDGEWKEFTI